MSLIFRHSRTLRQTTSDLRISSPTIPFPPRYIHNASRAQSGAAAATVSSTPTEPIPQHPIPPQPFITARPDAPRIKPEDVVAPELNHLKQQIALLLSSGLPLLDLTSKYYLRSNGKLFRPTVLFLMSRATSVAPKVTGWEKACVSLEGTFNTPIAPSNVLQDLNPDFALLSSRRMPINISNTSGAIAVLGTQRRLAEIVELIHTASLLHDDVLDHAETRRGAPSANVFSGNKMSILAGDFMLGRASVYLARLRQPEVIELIAEVIAELVKGELVQVADRGADYGVPETYLEKSLETYLRKTYLKSASLISKSCRAAAVLGGATEEVATAAYAYGKHMGLAFQLIDDVLDYTGTDAEIGKPANADLELGLATAPTYYAWEEFPELGPMIARGFSETGDAAKARDLVHKSRGIERTRILAHEYCQTARDSIRFFPDSDAKQGLEEILNKVLNRKK